MTRDGTAILACFPSVVGAVECALAIQHAFTGPASPLHVRIGLSAGEPVRDHGSLFGAAVQLAAAISNEAEPGNVLASGVVHDLCIGKNFVFAERGEVSLAGLPLPFHLWEVLGKEASSPPAVSSSHPYPDRLSEREVEVLRLIAAGRTNQEIGDQLFISRNTVIRHVSNIFDKPAVVNRAEAASFAHVHELA